MEKSETRRLAVELGLSVASKPDSQDICFVPTGKYTDVIEKIRPNAAVAGDIVTMDGEVLGQHRGIMYYTIGQRRGLGLGDDTGTEPLFVVRIEADNNQVIVGPRAALERSKIWLEDINWIGAGDYGPDLDGQAVRIKVRSTRPPVEAHFRLVDGQLIVELAQSDTGISPGQACVFYAADDKAARTLGGGWITRTA